MTSPAGDRQNIVIVVTGEDAGATSTLTRTATAADRAGRAVDELGDDLRGTAADAALLDSQIDELTANLRGLATQAARTGDMSVLRQIKADQREINNLKQVRSLLGEVADTAGDIAQTGAKAGGLFADGIMSGLGALPAQLKGALIVSGAGAAAAAAPLIAAALSGGILAGVGTGAVATGIALAVGDPRVKAEAAELGAFLKSELTESASAFVPATIGAIRDIRSEFSALRPELDRIADAAAPLTLGLTAGLTGLVREGLPGLRDGLAEVGPVVARLQGGLELLGAAGGAAIDRIGDSADAAGQGLADVLAITALGIRSTAEVVGVLTEGYGHLRVFSAYLAGGGAEVAKLKTEQAVAAATAKDWALRLAALGEELGGLVDPAAGAADAVGKVNREVQNALNMNLGYQGALLAWQAGLLDIDDAVKGNGRSLNENTEAGNANLQMIHRRVSEAVRLRESEIANGDAIGVVSARYGARLSILKAELTQTGLNRAKVEELVNAYGKVPTRVGTQLTANTAGASAAVAAYKRYLASIPRTVTTRLIAQQQKPFGGRHLEFAAAGGSFEAWQPVLVGEQGPELVTFAAPAQVYPAAQTRAMLGDGQGARMVTPASASGTGGGGPAGGTLTLRVVAGGGSGSALSGLSDAIIEVMMYALRVGRIRLRVDESGYVRGD